MRPATRTGMPTRRVASASKLARQRPQSTNSGPTSAATSATMIATANPSSVVCTGVLRAPSTPRMALQA